MNELILHEKFKGNNEQITNAIRDFIAKRGKVYFPIEMVRAIKTIGSEALICPYCGTPQDTYEPNDIKALMDLANCICLAECKKCGKAFTYSVGITKRYHSRKCD